MSEPAPRSAPVVAIVGATGAVGVELIRCLEQRHFPLSGLRLFASSRSAGRTLNFRGAPLAVLELREDSFQGVDIALFSAGATTSRRFVPVAVRAGATAVDNSSAFRLDPTVPLVVPEINGYAIRTHRGIIANPNCCAIIAITPLWPVQRTNRIARLMLSTYQAASGAGAAAMEELRESTRAYLEGRAYQQQVLPHPYAFNLFSHNSRIDPATGYNDEETKVIQETRKIFGDPQIRVSARRPVCACRCCARIRWRSLSSASGRSLPPRCAGCCTTLRGSSWWTMRNATTFPCRRTPRVRMRSWSDASART
jgi:aspartate-semialdehyde dehydrogenase